MQAGLRRRQAGCQGETTGILAAWALLGRGVWVSLAGAPLGGPTEARPEP